MKLLFLFMSGSKGFGGHHVSTHEMMCALRNLGYRCMLISFGKVSSVVFRNDMSSFNFSISPFNYSKLIEIRSFIEANNFDAYFPMDETSCRILCAIYPKALSRMIPVKPGWINVSSWINLTSDFICFSKENYDYMHSLKKYNKVRIHLIPNRVSIVKPDEERIRQFCSSFNIKKDEFVLFAVSRIDPDKTSVFYSALNLAEKMKEQGLHIRVFFIGTVSSDLTLNKLQSIQNDNLTIITDRRYTIDVSQLFKAADVVVCMGRTAMESLSQSIPTFVPINNSDLPVLIDCDSYDSLLESNFTYRSKISNDVMKKNLDKIKKIYTDYPIFAEQSKSLFDENLNVEKGAKEYAKIAHSQLQNKRNRFYEFRAGIYSYLRWTVFYLKSKI